MLSEQEFKSFLTKSPNKNNSYVNSLKSKVFHDYATTMGVTDIFSVTDISIIKSLYDGLCDKSNSPAMASITDSNDASRSAIREYAAYLRKMGYATNDSGQLFPMMKSSGSRSKQKRKVSSLSSTLWSEIIKKFEEYLTKNGGSCKSKKYSSLLNTINDNNGGATMTWINNAINDDKPIKYLDDEFDKVFTKGTKDYDDLKTALHSFGKMILSSFKADICLKAVPNFDETACELVASTAIFCEIEVADEVKRGVSGSKCNISKGNEYYSWYNCTVRRDGTRSNQKFDSNGIRLDDNTYANRAIKKAIGIGLERKYGFKKSVKIKDFNGFGVCHIWDGTCYDEKYHTSVANLVLIPRSIAGLSDHCEEVKDILKYESWRRFGFKPDGEPTPVKPKLYDKLTWSNPPTKYVN